MLEHLADLLPGEKQATTMQLAGALAKVPGMIAIVLGGSYARGSAHAQSDVDLGLYYRPGQPFSIDVIRRIAGEVAIEPPTVTDFYEWGAWVNGGAWIRTVSSKVDFLYRNLDQVESTIAEAEQGIVHHDYPQQPPYGFYSITYLAETQVCIPLFDPHGIIADLKGRVHTYPDSLRTRVVGDGLWSAEFTLLHARTFAAKGDVYNTVGCLTRVATNLTQVLFALNRRYYMSDKGVMELIDTLPLTPPAYAQRLTEILAMPGFGVPDLTSTVRTLEGIWQDVVDLTAGAYEPRFVVP